MQYKCKICQQNFEAYKYQKRIYCSQQCHFKDHQKTVKCPQCGIERVLQKNASQKEYCSLACWSLHRRKYPERTCNFCNKLFYSYVESKEGSKSHSNKYCSKGCADKGRTLPLEEYKKRRYEYTKKYRLENPDKARQYKNNRRAREMGAEGSFTATEWTELKEKHKQMCALCGKKEKLTVDHIVPLSKGGSNYITNIQPLCMPCNSKKSAKI